MTLKIKLNNIYNMAYNIGMVYTFKYYANRFMQVFYSSIVYKKKMFIPLSTRIIGKNIEIGDNFTAGKELRMEEIYTWGKDNIQFSPYIMIGDNVTVNDYVHIGCAGRVVIGNDVLIGSKVYISDHDHGMYSGEVQDTPFKAPNDRNLCIKEVVIGDNVWVGEFVCILKGVHIGSGSIIGAHSTVTHDIPSNSIAVGSPAVVIKTWDNKIAKWVKV